MPIPAEPYVWGALLGACRIHHNVKIGELVAKDPFHLDPKNDAYYTSLWNLYVVDEKWGNVAKVNDLVKEKGLKKTSWQSVIEVKGEVHRFITDDRLHSKCKWLKHWSWPCERTGMFLIEVLFHYAETV